MDSTQDKAVEIFMKSMSEALEDFLSLREKIISFQLHLVTISGATFSIFTAIGQSKTSLLTKWGFIALMISFIFGLISIMFRYLHLNILTWSKIFKIERSVFSEKNDSKIKEILAGHNPLIYREDLDVNLMEEQKQILMKKMFEATKNVFDLGAIILTLLQFFFVIVATLLFLINLIKIPIL